jgi:hypothetical protein
LRWECREIAPFPPTPIPAISISGYAAPSGRTAYHGNVNREPPFDRTPGQSPALNDAEIGDVIAFLNTLTDADLQPSAQP